jgi:phage baseplate assembly protein W
MAGVPSTSPAVVIPNLLGRGVAFPVRKATTGGLLLAEGEELVYQAIMELLDTNVGEGIRAFDVRNGVPYGTRLRRYLFDSMTHVRELAGYEVKRALDVWEPRIHVLGVDVQAPTDAADELGRRRVAIVPHFVFRATNREDNLVVPYWLRVR